MLAEGPRLSFKAVVLTTTVIDIDLTRMNRARLMSFQPDQLGDTENRVVAPFQFPKIEPQPRLKTTAAWEASQNVKSEEFARAVALGLFDYLRKSRSQGFVVSLSGGSDSSAVATLVWLLVKLGVAELGLHSFLSKLSHIPDLAQAADLPSRLLTCVYQATRNSFRYDGTGGSETGRSDWR